MRRLYLLCALAIFALPLSAQINSAQIGKVGMPDLQMTSYDADKDAEAVVLRHLGSYYYTKNYEKGEFCLNMEIFTRIKILSRAGIDYATFEIPYYASSDIESVANITGTTYNLENGVIQSSELMPSNIFDEKSTDKWRVKKIAMPNVREGSVIELKYTIESYSISNMRKWEFQAGIPVMFSSLSYTAIPFYEFSYLLRGATKFDRLDQQELPGEEQFRQLNYKELRYTMEMRNLPAFRDEEFISSRQDHMVSLIFQLAEFHRPGSGSQTIMTSWPEICSRLIKSPNFGKYISAAEKEGKTLLPTLPVAGRSKKEQIRTITDYVKHNYNWDGYNALYSEGKLADVLKNKKGNSADLNLMLVGLLRAAGITADPIVLSTRGHGSLSKGHPFIDHLNYVIVGASDETGSYLIDACESMLDFNILPPRCLNVNALVVKEKGEEWITTAQQVSSYTTYTQNITVDPQDNTASAEVLLTATTYDAMQLREIYLDDNENLRKHITGKGAEKVEQITVTNYETLSAPLMIAYKAEYPIEHFGEEIFISPFMSQSPQTNIFNQTSRRLPIDLMIRQSQQFTSTIHIPKGYKVKHLPEALDKDNAVMTIKYNCSASDDGTITVTGIYKMKKESYFPLEYTSLKASYGEMVQKFTDRIVLEKE